MESIVGEVQEAKSNSKNSKGVPGMRKKKFRRGRRITRVSEFLRWIDLGGWVYLRNKPIHPSFICSMPFRTVVNYIDYHSISEAIRTEE